MKCPKCGRLTLIDYCADCKICLCAWCFPKHPLNKLEELLKKGLEEQRGTNDDCNYPACDECGECYFREALKMVEDMRGNC